MKHLVYLGEKVCQVEETAFAKAQEGGMTCMTKKQTGGGHWF